jgi:propionate CoA-transferase
MAKPIVNAAEAASMVKSGWTITTGGFGSCGHPEVLTSALRERFLNTGSPRNLKLMFAAGQGDKQDQGLNKLACKGLLDTIIGGYWALTPKLGQMVEQESVKAYNWPQGVMSHLFRAIAGGKPGVVTSIGLNTFVDPRQDGGKLNAKTKDQLVELISLQGQEQLFYPSCPIHCAFLRGTVADEEGNISMISEASFQDNLAQAQAVHNSGGIVIVQVLKVVAAGSLPAHEIRIPGIFVDYLVVANEDEHWQTYGEKFNPLFTGSVQAASTDNGPVAPLDIRKIIARRAYLETLKYEHPVINLGIGMPECVSLVAREEVNGQANFTLTVESGAIGGYPAGGLSFGASVSPRAILEQPSQFDFYDGGGINMAFLGFGEIDQYGNVNVSRLGNKLNGVGGFVNISQSSKRVIFCGAFTAGGLNILCNEGKIKVINEGRVKKFVKKVRQINFNAKHYGSSKENVTYITERGVFELSNGQLVLTEVAPGIDIERDILNQADTAITVSSSLIEMNAAIFNHEKMQSFRLNNWVN